MNNRTNVKDAHKPRRAVCYLRVASAQAELSTAVEVQRRACERKAQELGATIVDEYLDQGTSGNTDDRPALQAMLARLKSDPHISCVITYDHARLARNIEVYRRIVRALEAARVVRVIAKEPGPHTHRFMQTMVAAVAELDAQHRREARRARKAVSS